jgi:hypothetical protein
MSICKHIKNSCKHPDACSIFASSMEDQEQISQPTGKAKGGIARAQKLSDRRRSDIAREGARAKWKKLGRITPLAAQYGAPDRPLRIGPVEIPCYVLADGTRVLAQRGLQSGIGLSEGGGKGGERRIAAFMARLGEKGIDVKGLVARANNPIPFIPPHGGNPADGYEATILPDICAVIIDADQKGKLDGRLKRLAERAAVLQHGFATVGIIALVDEATGYQEIRQKDALAVILERFIAKELQPYVPTFQKDYYEQLFRLRGLEFPKDTVQRPQYFGVLTNDIVYKRIAPGVLEELKKVVIRNEDGRPKHKYFQRLTSNLGYPKLREHLGGVVAIMKLSSDYLDFLNKLDRIYPRYGQVPLDFDLRNDDGRGL